MDDLNLGYSAECHGHLVVGQQRYALARLGPHEFGLSKPINLPCTEAELVLVIDGHEQRTKVSLDEGSSDAADLVSYRRL